MAGLGGHALRRHVRVEGEDSQLQELFAEPPMRHLHEPGPPQPNLFDAPPPPEPVGMQPVRVGGALQCPLCPAFSTRGQVRALMVHISRTHEGERVNAQGCAGLHALGRGICMQEGRGALRPHISGRCAKCHGAVGVRRLQVGDVLPLSAGARAAEAANARAPAELANEHPEAVEFQFGLPQLPANFRERVKRLSPNTMQHIPPLFRHQMCSITARNLEGSNQGLDEAAMLEEASAKLLLAHIP